MRHGSMFAGIGGFERGFEMVAWPAVPEWQAEINPYCLRILEREWPDVSQIGDVAEVEEFPACDVLTAGFPCQPASQAGKGLAQQDERWLWPHVARAIETARPALVILENVRGLRNRGLADVLRDLADLGYDAQWDLVPAAAVGAPHLRHRFWIVAYPRGTRMGPIFDIAPPVFPWPEEEPALPRLLAKVPSRTARIEALGNAIVPHMASYVALAITRALWGEMNVEMSLFDEHPAPGYAGILVDGKVHERETCVRPIKERLWPTPSASESRWSVEALARTVHVNGEVAHDPHKRLYHPETGQIVQRTLTNYVKGVEAGLWPTPLVTDARSARRATARTDEWTSKDGRTLLDAVWEAEGIDASETFGSRGASGELLWPTPAARDVKGPSGAGFLERRDGGPDLAAAARDYEDGLWPTPRVRDAGAGPDMAREEREGWHGGLDLVTAVHRRDLWPTPLASDGNGKGGNDRRGSQEDGSWRSINLVDAVVTEEDNGNSSGGDGRTLSPRWVEWLQGYPLDYTKLD